MSFFDKVDLLPADPILNLPVAFAADPRPNKINLGIGAYKDDSGNPLVLSCVRKAESQLFQNDLNKEYLPIEGDPSYLNESLKLIFGKDHPTLQLDTIFAAQTIGGTGALRIGCELLLQKISKAIYISQPTWPNHKALFSRTGMPVEAYPYYDPQSHSLDFSAMCAYIQQIPSGNAILLQASCHNPTGIDPTFEQWRELSKLVKTQKLIPFFDLAYQGFGIGIDEDANPVRYFAKEGHEMLVATSYSKNLGLYGERAGMLAVVTHSKEEVVKVASQIRQIIRSIYSSPPLHGARIVKTVLQSPQLKQEWLRELADMRGRIAQMRQDLVAGLLAKGADKSFNSLIQQSGIFSFCGLNQQQVHRLIQEKGIYMPSDGRINVAGLNKQNLDYIIESILSVLKQ